MIKFITILRAAKNRVFGEKFGLVERHARVLIAGVMKLSIETPESTGKKFVMLEAHEITLNVKFDGEGGNVVILGSATQMMGETFLAVERAFVATARIRISNKMAIPPITTKVIE